MLETTLTINTLELGPVAHIGQYFGPWAMLETRFVSLMQFIDRMDLKAHVLQAAPLNAASGKQESSNLPYLIRAGIGLMSLRGEMTKYGSSLSNEGSTLLAKRTLRQAAADPAVHGILMVIDSPGGTVDGTADLAKEVARVNAFKPVTVFIEDCGCSAAYWVASQAGKVMANATAVTGSIGVYAVIEDWSKAAADAGIKVHVIKAGKFKGAGTFGTEVTQDQIDEFQRIIDEINQQFVDAVAAGRGLKAKDAAKLADGRVHVGQSAVGLGLVDSIGTFDDALAMAHQQIELRQMAA